MADRTAPADMVACPRCGHENVRGADACDECLSDLSALGMPSSEQFDTPLSEVRLSKPTIVRATATVREAVYAIVADHSGAAVVVGPAGIVGVFTERDVLHKIAGRPLALGEPVSLYMTKDPVVLRDDDTMAHALNKMGLGGFRHIPLARDGQPVAMVTARDVMQWLMSCYFE